MIKSNNITEPFDPSTIEVEIKNFTINTLVEMMKNGMIDMAPSFQRNAEIWSDEKRSRLIESLILGLPLPSFYFNYDSSQKKWIVIDGLQRLGALKAFMIDKSLALKGLDFLSDYYADWTFDNFPYSDRLNMGMLTVTANIIKGNTPQNVKYILFQRINSAGTPLNPQEIRNALNQGTASKLLMHLADNPLFKKMVAVNTKRMADCEYVLRFIAFTIGDYSTYKNKMELFLNDQMSKINTYDEISIKKFEDDFVSCLSLWDDVLGSLAFKNPSLKHNKGVSKALYDMLMVLSHSLSPEERAMLINNKEIFKENYRRIFFDSEFTELLANGTSKLAKIRLRNKKMRLGIDKAIKGEYI